MDTETLKKLLGSRLKSKIYKNNTFVMETNYKYDVMKIELGFNDLTGKLQPTGKLIPLIDIRDLKKAKELARKYTYKKIYDKITC